MFLDDLLKLADAQESTISVASTSWVPTFPNLGTTMSSANLYQGAFMHVRIDTAYVAAAGQPWAQFILQTSDTAGFGTYTEIASSGTHLAAALTIGTVFNIPIPPAGVKRFLRGYLKVGVADGSAVDGASSSHYFSAGKFDMFIVRDVDSHALLK